MKNTSTTPSLVKETIPKLHLFDGYFTEPFFKPLTTSCYYDLPTDLQARVPIRSIETVKRELGLK